MQRNVAVGSGEVKVNVDVFEVLSFGGCAVIWVVGGVRSTVHVYVTGGGEVPVWPCSCTLKECWPSARFAT